MQSIECRCLHGCPNHPICNNRGTLHEKLGEPEFTFCDCNPGSFGKFLPDIGAILLNGDALDLAPANGGISLGTATGVGTNSANITKIYNAINDGGNFVLRSEETVSSNYIFVRARNSEFNYSTNPSNITGSGELRHSAMIDSPQAYVTSVGLYNDNNDLLGIAKLSRPLLKDFTKESLIRVKLDY